MGRKKEISDEELLSIARACFIEHGPSIATSVIAKQAGVSQATLFNRFQSKRSLMLEAMFPPGEEKILDIVGQPVDDRPIPTQLLDKAVQIFLHFQTLEPHMNFLEHAGLCVKELFAHHAAKHGKAPPPLRAFQAMEQWVRDAQSLGRMGMTDARTFTQVFMGSIHSVIFFRRIHGAFDTTSSSSPMDEQRARQYFIGVIDVLWRGISPVTT